MRVLWGAECKSDHHLIKAGITLSLNRKCIPQQNQNEYNLVDVEERSYHLTSLDERARELYIKRSEHQLPQTYKHAITKNNILWNEQVQDKDYIEI